MTDILLWKFRHIHQSIQSLQNYDKSYTIGYVTIKINQQIFQTLHVYIFVKSKSIPGRMLTFCEFPSRIGLFLKLYMSSCYSIKYGRKEGNILFNDTLNTFHLWLYGIRHMERTTHIAREETHCHHMGYSF